ncbi:MAG: hypothetical protein U5M50_08620 [Sphingobium sp.]|nr:hypothetical protein [Sphingobium sp.]
MAAAKKPGTKPTVQDTKPAADAPQVDEAQRRWAADVAASTVPVVSPSETGADSGNATAPEGSQLGAILAEHGDGVITNLGVAAAIQRSGSLATFQGLDEAPALASHADLKDLQEEVLSLRSMVLSLEMRFAELAQAGGIQFPALRNRGGIRRHTALMPLSMDKDYAAGDPVDVSEDQFVDLKAAQVFEGEWEDGEPVDDED